MSDTADLGDVTIAYEVLGDPDAPRLVHVSGSGSELRHEPSVADTPLVEHFQVLAYDHRGLGRSTAGPHRPTMAEFGHDLLRLLDHVGWDRCFALGVGFGGMVLQDAAVSAPWRFPKLVLACTSPAGQGGARLPTLTMPVLIAAGRHDGTTPPADQEAMASQMAESAIEWFDGGHDFLLEDRRAYPAIIDFLLRS